MPSFQFNVSLGRKVIDTVSYTFDQKTTKACMCEYVRQSLINHDGYDPDIKVRCISRTTKSAYIVQTFWQGSGWCDDTEEETRQAGKLQVQSYRYNGCTARLITRQVSVFS